MSKSGVNVFKGKLLQIIRRRYAEAPVLDEKGKIVKEQVRNEDGTLSTFVDSKGSVQIRTKVKKQKFKDIEYLFKIYHNLSDLDEFILLMYEKAADKKKSSDPLDMDLRPLLDDYRTGISFIKRRFKSKVSDTFMTKATKTGSRLDTVLGDIEGAFNKDHRKAFDVLKKVVVTPNFKAMMQDLFEIVSECFEIMGLKTVFKKKMNPTLKHAYMQFALDKSLESSFTSVEEKDEARKADLVREMLKVQEMELESNLLAQGYKVETFALAEGGQREVVKVAYRKGAQDIKPVPKPAALRIPEGTPKSEADALTAEYNSRPEVIAYERYIALRERFVEGVYSTSFLEDNPDGTRRYKVFPNVASYKAEIARKHKKDALLEQIFPTVTIANREDRTYDISFSGGRGSASYKLTRYDNVEFSEEEPRTREVSDGDGTGKGLRRTVQVKKALINGELRDVIISGRYKGFLFEDMVNVNGRLLEGSYMIKVDGKSMERELVTDGDLVFAAKDAQGTISSRLNEPYITLSEDKTRLCIGIPSSQLSGEDRKAMADLSKSIATIERKIQFPIPESIASKPDSELTEEEKALKRKLNTVNTQNPFYYFRPEDYEIIRDTLGSVALSKSASEFLDRYFDQLTKRDRALNAENLKRFTPEEIGGFVSNVGGKPFRFNNKQKEAMAWMEANNYSGLMALDTGVGKTLLSVGAIRKAMKEEEGEERKFLFVSPSRLVGNIEKEIEAYIEEKDKAKTLDRITEMDYEKYTDILASEGEAYFKKEFFAVFFDEVNEALTKKKYFTAVSDLRHPHKILLTASAMEKDPVDLYKFVTLAQGVPYEQAKANAWAQRYSNEIGGRRIGVTKDPRIQQEFYRWVKANAYFASKEDVDYTDIGQPELKKPVTTSIPIRMNPEVMREYRKVAAEISAELQGMIRKYRDADYDPLSYEVTEERILRGKKKEVTRVLKDYAAVAIPKAMKTLMLLSTDPEQVLGDKAGINPKIEQCTDIIKTSGGTRILFFCSENKMAIKTAMSNALAAPAKVHAVLTSSKIEFYSASKGGAKKVAVINKRTDYEGKKWKDMEKSIRLAKEEIEDEEDATWAMRAVKEYIAKNAYVGTIVCTDAYARGFNLQEFKKVVHLDRGKGFDSELLKQRTARAYRTGQTAQVEEIFLDSTLARVGEDEMDAGMISVQEIQKLVNERDQAFFQEIIKGGMSQSLVDSVDKVERTTGEEVLKGKRTSEGKTLSSDYLAQLLDPTPAAVARFEEKKRLVEEMPFTHGAALDPARFDGLTDANIEIKPDAESFLKRAGYTVHDLLDLAGITGINKDTRIEVTKGQGASINVSRTYPTRMDRSRIDRIVDLESKHIKNEIFISGECAADGYGARSVFTQIITCMNKGFVPSLYAAMAGGSMVGYKVWPKFGYDGTIRAEPFVSSLFWVSDEQIMKSLARRGIISLIEVRRGGGMLDVDNMGDLPEDAYIKAREVGDIRVSDILASLNDSGENIGLEWWDRRGLAFEGTFDTKPGSLSLRVLNEYFRKKCMELDVSPEDYMSKPLSPFDVNSYRCWKSFYNTNPDNIDLLRNTVIEYATPFKKVMYSTFPEDWVLDLLEKIGNVPGMKSVKEYISEYISGSPRTASVHTASSSDIDPELKSVWKQIGLERDMAARKIEIIEEENPSDITAVVAQELKTK